jgi:hypothetical protein
LWGDWFDTPRRLLAIKSAIPYTRAP